ncbi:MULTISPECIES: ABC transporter ATP-binding protein [Faecalicoccus]|uniref:ABC transporter ATP-binding protein n=1 Tax=Faecalicoccus pleomorphus TaxID=1323 RepID=A0AAW6CX30_9FIRM|nr:MULTISPECIES: ABC transporter ATP-binding protein [Faecalicoccus]MCI6380523.1 ABC transporter ATP-binding protein/permease [Erysipelotrichaceae bacterium]MDB7980836.1 ABC transporter ATP-binding protein [Faecalicoccus pleomorphus]MDB7983049.1 ABC transporter ATP-binding protein [Faecalicoccus pleomorphus]MDY4870022.1 ABC transporter ATP-binding protein [Faecalicoccus sp.]
MNKTKNNGLSRIIKVTISNYKLACFFILIFILISCFANVYGSTFLKDLIDVYIVPMLSQDTPDFGPLVQALLTLLCIYVAGILCTYLYNRILLNVALGTLRDTRDHLFEHMETLPIGYFDTYAHGDIMSIYTNDTDTLRQLLTMAVPQMIVSIVTMISVLISMLILDIPLTIVAIVMAVIMIIVSRFITSRSGRYFRAQQDDLGKVNGFIEEMVEGSKVIKVFCHEEQSLKDFNVVNDQLFKASANANMYANILMPIIGNLGYLSYVLTAIIGSLLALNGIGGLTLGTIAAFLQLNRSFNNPIGQISQQINSVVMAAAGASRIFELIDTPSEVDDGKVTLTNVEIHEDGSLSETDKNTGHWCWRHPREDGSVELVPLKGDVRFHDVIFGYNEKKTILHDINLFAKPGEKIAFVGATGAGKTTITNLINRFYDIQNGSITYDGIDIKLIKKDDLRRSLGIVLQDTNLFTGTIMDNIRYGKLDASDDECIKAAKLANAHEFIKHLDHGYQTMITGSGTSLSQGQKQLLSIARAAVANPPVLILDEATSSIDTHTERIVQDGMDKLMQGRTVFVIAHRLSTIQNSDAIMVLENGRIIERGSHDDLIQQKGTYYQLYTGAFELE